jgi:hypothetical protein
MNEEIKTPSDGSVAVELETPDLESVMHLIWDRLDALEAERRRVRRTAICCAAALVVIAVLWTGLPRGDGAGTPIVLRDSSGHVRAKLEADPESGNTVFQLVGADGNPQALLGSDATGPMLTFFDKQGSARMRIGLEAETDAPVVDVIDKNGGPQGRVNLVSARATAVGTTPPAPSVGVRYVSAKTWRQSHPSIPLTRGPGSFMCPPGTLGCGRMSRAERPPGAS